MIGGRLGGRRLGRPPTGVRPTADRVRESLFERLGALDGLRVLDLFAGTGALGIEAISRGAAGAVFVDSAAPSLAVLRRNLETLALSESCRVLRSDAAAAVRRLGRSDERFELVFADAPYESDALEPTLAALLQASLLTPDATVVVETAARHAWEPVPGLSLVDQRRYGDTLIMRLRPTPAGSEAESPIASQARSKE